MSSNTTKKNQQSELKNQQPQLITIFGGTGDLTFRKLLPALYNMDWSGHLPDLSRILIIGRRDYTSDIYREMARSWVEEFSRLPYTTEHFDQFAERIHYMKMDFTNINAYPALADYYMENHEKELIFYFAVAPHFFAPIAEGLSMIPAAREGKLVLEKPFGVDLAEAKQLNARLEQLFGDERIYRIDHYLGKEMVRNISSIRFTNPIFNYIWDARQIEYVEISAMEEVGVESRGGYYDNAGALSDMVQNHLFQILSILSMERPAVLYGDELRQEQLRVLRYLVPPADQNVYENLVLGQYEGYRQEPKVDPESKTETFAALRVFIDNDRWRGMPFYIKTGKKTGKREMKVVVAFRRLAPDLPRNTLVIHIQPSEGVDLKFNMKKPGETEDIIQARMEFSQDSSKAQSNTPEAYERLLTACIEGEQYWFSQWEQIEAGWKYVEDLKRLAAEQGVKLHEYPQGKPGPEAVIEMKKLMGHE